MTLRLAAPVAISFVLTACAGASGPAADDPSSRDGRRASRDVDPDSCGSYAATDAGRKIYAFLQATVWLQQEVHESEVYLHDSCQLMAQELGIQPVGNTAEVCDEVIAALDENLDAGLSARAALEVDYQPAVCEVSVDTAAHAAAECEGGAHAEVASHCEGECLGTCQGTCEGECVGGASADSGGGDGSGECDGECRGTCYGTCTGTCTGHTDVEVDASCQAHAEVRANTEATCTEPEIHVTYEGDVVADAERLEAALAAIDVGLPRLVSLHAKLTGPVQAAFTTWADTATELAAAGPRGLRGLGDSAVCVAGQLAAAAAAIASIEASISVQVEVSASASATVGGG